MKQIFFIHKVLEDKAKTLIRIINPIRDYITFKGLDTVIINVEEMKYMFAKAMIVDLHKVGIQRLSKSQAIKLLGPFWSTLFVRGYKEPKTKSGRKMLGWDYRDKSLSQATMLTKDIMEEIFNRTPDWVWKDIGLFGLIEGIIATSKQSASEPSYSGVVSLNTADNILDDTMWNRLNEVAPHGYYFGAHPSDGADFGFWKVEK